MLSLSHCKFVNLRSLAGERTFDSHGFLRRADITGRYTWGWVVRSSHSISIPHCFMANAKESAAAPSAAKPVATFRRRGVAVSVFANQIEVEDKLVTFHKVAIQRIYRDGDEFKSTTGFGRDDLPILSLLVSQAWEFILDRETGRAADEAE